MNRAIVLLGLFLCSTFAPAAFADVPGVSREARQRMFEERMRAEARARAEHHLDGASADVTMRSANGGVQLLFFLAGPGGCEYTLHGPLSGDASGPVAAKGSRAWDGQEQTVLEENVTLTPAPEENVRHSYRLEALCRVKVVEQTNFGPKETGQVKEVRITHRFTLRRESFYRVTPVKQ